VSNPADLTSRKILAVQCHRITRKEQRVLHTTASTVTKIANEDFDVITKKRGGGTQHTSEDINR